VYFSHAQERPQQTHRARKKLYICCVLKKVLDTSSATLHFGPASGIEHRTSSEERVCNPSAFACAGVRGPEKRIPHRNLVSCHIMMGPVLGHHITSHRMGIIVLHGIADLYYSFFLHLLFFPVLFSRIFPPLESVLPRCEGL
jgi:hypothetical protein